MRFKVFVGLLLAVVGLQGAMAQREPGAPATAECDEVLTVRSGRILRVLRMQEDGLRTVLTHRVRGPWRGIIQEALYACEQHKLVVNGTKPHWGGTAIWTSLIDVLDDSVQAVATTGPGDNQFFLSGTHAWRVTAKVAERLSPDDPRWPALALESIDLVTGQVSLSPRAAYGGGKIWPLSRADWVMLSFHPYAHESAPPTGPQDDPRIDILPAGEKIDAATTLWATSTQRLVLAQPRCDANLGGVRGVTLQSRTRGALRSQPIADIELPAAYRLFGDRHGALIVGADRTVYVDLATGPEVPMVGWPAGWDIQQAAATPASIFVLLQKTSGMAAKGAQAFFRLDRARGQLQPLPLPINEGPIHQLSTREPGLLTTLPLCLRGSQTPASSGRSRTSP